MTLPISTHRYPVELKDENYEAALVRVQNSAYAEDDAPYLRTQRINLSSEYEKADIAAKLIVDTVGAADNAWWFEHWKENGL